MYPQLTQQGVEVLAFPCNQFLRQEPGTNQEVCEHVRNNLNAKFPIFEKIDVNGSNAHPVYQFLRAKTDPKPIGWNFGKFLVDKTGTQIQRFEPKSNPKSLLPYIEKLVAQ
eukprot:GFYU01000090.1.p2 GENE.GFYU01000090.1~~GFYU01000090.1.p2  ORF type:complete len:111 (+),score=23.17 GFYU01000090.1:222-554(+)